MGDIPAIMALLRAPGNSDRELLAVLNPSQADRQRTTVVVNPRLPTLEPWRFRPAVGALNTVTSNFFRVDTSKIPKKLYQYALHLYQFNVKLNQFDSTDCAGEEEDRILWTLYKKLAEKHPEWNLVSGKVGCAFSGRSVLFTTALLAFPSGSINAQGEAYHEENIAMPDLEGILYHSIFFIYLNHCLFVTWDCFRWRF